jgi:hypothetical protein
VRPLTRKTVSWHLFSHMTDCSYFELEKKERVLGTSNYESKFIERKILLPL